MSAKFMVLVGGHEIFITEQEAKELREDLNKILTQREALVCMIKYIEFVENHL